MVLCERVRDSALSHDYEANAIDETPFFVVPRFEEIPPFLIQPHIDDYHFDPIGRLDPIYCVDLLGSARADSVHVEAASSVMI